MNVDKYGRHISWVEASKVWYHLILSPVHLILWKFSLSLPLYIYTWRNIYIDIDIYVHTHYTHILLYTNIYSYIFHICNRMCDIYMFQLCSKYIIYILWNVYVNGKAWMWLYHTELYSYRLFSFPFPFCLFFFNASFSNKLLLSTQVSHITKAMFSIVSCIFM